MKKLFEVIAAAVVLTSLYFAVPSSQNAKNNVLTGPADASHVILIADGTAPIPIKR